MADPFNKSLIADYMAWEKANAVKQIEEVERLTREHRALSLTAGKEVLKK